MNLGENISKLRKSLKLSQEKLAEKIGVTRQTISNWELGETYPNPEQLKLLSKTLNVSVDKLLDNDIKSTIKKDIGNTEKLAGTVIKILKIIGIIFIIFLVIDFISLIIFNLMNPARNMDGVNNMVSLECRLNDNDYNYVVESDEEDNILNYSGSDFIDNILVDSEFEFGSTMIKYIETYFKDNGGSCKQKK